jgi:hypothetical protein
MEGRLMDANDSEYNDKDNGAGAGAGADACCI